MRKIKTFRSDTKKSLKVRNKELLDFIDYEVRDKEYNSLLKWLSKIISIPVEVLEKESKIFIHKNYLAKKAKFKKNFNFTKIFKSILTFFGFFFWIYLFSKSESKIKTTHADIIVDDVLDEIEAKNFWGLKKYFSKVLFVSKVKLSNEYDHLCFKYKNLNKKILFSEIPIICSVGFFLILKSSVKLKINLLDIFTYLIRQTFKCENLFTQIKSKYLIQLRPYGTSEIKRFIYHKHGGKVVSVIQKNPEQLTRPGGTAYADILFTLGLKTGENAIVSGGNYNKIIPVGSLVMESWFFNANINDEKIPSYDLMNIIGNYSEFSDGTENYISSYYEHCRWLKKFAEEFPKLSVVIKRRPGDGTEKNFTFLNFFKNSKVKIISGEENFDDKKEWKAFVAHSYHHAFKAKVICTWQSTMGLEFIGNGKPCIFMDPGGYNNSIFFNNETYNKIKAKTYEEFKKTYFEIVNGTSKMFNLKKEDYCLRSDNVSKRISDCLKNGSTLERYLNE